MFFKKRPAPAPFKPDLTRVRLYNGDYYGLSGDTVPTYTLCEWDEDWDPVFPELAMDCALAILDDFPVVVNCLYPGFVGGDVHDEEEIAKYLRNIRELDLGLLSNSGITLTHGPDRGLVASFDHDDDWFQMFFYGYRQLPAGSTLSGTPFVPDVRLYFKHLHTCLTITTANSIDIFAEKIREVCKKYGKTLVVQELPSKAKD
ncbi:MAG: hypothetical protein J6Q14_07615 [Oscillospiraceae bacterium]|nr:hypothetical protein [Oscillospiraceae bacterium]